MPNTTTTTNTATPRTVAERQAVDGLAAIRDARAKRRDAATAPLAIAADIARAHNGAPMRHSATAEPQRRGVAAPLAVVVVPLAERFGAGATVDVVPRWRGAALCVHEPIRDGVPTPTRAVWVITSTAYGYSAGTYRGTLAAAVKLARLWDAEFAAALDAAPIGAAGVPTLANWPQARAWSRQVTGDAPASGPVDAAPTLPQLRADAAAGRPVSLAALARATTEPQRREPVAAADGDGADQYPATPTLAAVVVDGERRIRYARRLPDGRERLRTPDARRLPVRMHGDVAAFADGAGVRLRLWFADAWRDVPSIAELMEWTLDGVAESPDGSRIEPDAPESWLTLLGIN